MVSQAQLGMRCHLKFFLPAELLWESPRKAEARAEPINRFAWFGDRTLFSMRGSHPPMGDKISARIDPVKALRVFLGSTGR